MAGSLNQVQIIGNLARDPEIRTFDNGNKVCNLRVITNETYTDRDGNRQDKSEGHSVSIWNERLIETAERYLKKGDKVFLQGKIETRKYQDKNGNDAYATEVVLPKFNSTLTMLGGNSGDREFDGESRGSGGRSDDRGGSRGGGGNRGGGSRDDNRGGGRDDNRGGGNRGGGNGGGGGRGGYADDLDDDVPF